jgi:hypothetical protein
MFYIFELGGNAIGAAGPLYRVFARIESGLGGIDFPH